MKVCVSWYVVATVQTGITTSYTHRPYFATYPKAIQGLLEASKHLGSQQAISTMKISFTALAVLAVPAFSQSTTAGPLAPVVTPPWATSDLPKWSSLYNSLVSAGKVPTTLTAAPWPTSGYGPGSGPWGPGNHGDNDNDGPGSRGPGGWGGTSSPSPTRMYINANRNITGPNGAGPWGTGSYGPWSEWSTKTDWRSGPWTAWWDGSACPPSNWPGWTAGPWSTAAPWTTWSGCTASTTATSVSTATVNGTAVPTTAYGLQVAAASGTSAAATTGSTGSADMKTVSMGLVVGAAMLGLAVGL